MRNRIGQENWKGHVFLASPKKSTEYTTNLKKAKKERLTKTHVIKVYTPHAESRPPKSHPVFSALTKAAGVANVWGGWLGAINTCLQRTVNRCTRSWRPSTKAFLFLKCKSCFEVRVLFCKLMESISGKAAFRKQQIPIAAL